MPSGLILLATDSFTAVTSVSLNNVFSATYKQYKIVTNVSGSSAANVSFRLRASGTDNSSTNYIRRYIVGTSTSVVTARETGQTVWSGFGRAEVGAKTINITEILNPFQSTYTSAFTSFIPTPTGNLESLSAVFTSTVTTSYDGFTISPGFDATTFTGTVAVYGLVV